MPLNNFAYRLRGEPQPKRLAVVGGLLAVAVVLAFVFTQLSVGEHRLANWWPPAGFAAGAAIIAKRRELSVVLPVVFISTGLASLTAHRPVLIAVAGAVGATTQCWLVRRSAVDAQDRPRLFTVGDATRLTVGVVAGGLTIAASVFAGRLAYAGAADALYAGIQVAAGTTSAIALIVPFIIISRRRRSTQKIRRVAVSYTATIVATLFAFWPSQTQAFTFVPLPFLAWAAFSLSMSTALVQVMVTSVLALVSTGSGGGPFSDASGPVSAVAMIEIFVIANAAMCVFIACIRNERDSNAEQRAAAAALVRQGFARAGGGFVVLRDTEHQTFGILDMNDTSANLLPTSLREVDGRYSLDVHSDLYKLCLAASRSHGRVERRWVDAAPVSVVVEELPDTVNDRVLLVTVLDLSAVEAAAHAADEQLQQARETSERLRQTNEKHDLFVASVTHELRTPLTSIIGYTEEALDTAENEETRGHLAIVQRNAERLFALVQDVLTSTRPRSPRVPEQVDVTAAIMETIDDLRREAISREVSLTSSVPPGLTHLGSDAELRQALVNLLANAVKFTPRGGTVNVTAIASYDALVVEIMDTGPGMSDDEISRAFDRFYRARSAVSQGIPGTGLGLGIARDAVEANCGTLTLARSDPHGLTARITLLPTVAEPQNSTPLGSEGRKALLRRP